MLWISLLAGLAGATELEDSALPLEDSGDTGVLGLPDTDSDTDTDTDGGDTGEGSGTGTGDTEETVEIPWSEGPGAAEISNEAGGHSWKGCAQAPGSAGWVLPLVWLVLRRQRA